MKTGMPLKIKMLKNWATYMYKSDMFKRYVYSGKKKPIQHQDPKVFREILQAYSQETAFVHAGLKAVKKAFPFENPYQFLFDELRKNFKNILVPGFTPSFRRTGIYHKKFSLPEYGAFSRLFLKDTHSRTNDAIHSILTNGYYHFIESQYHDSFGRYGCFSKIDEDNILIINIGTDWVVSSQFHFVENLMQVPYMEAVQYPGILYYDEKNYISIVQGSFRYTKRIQWNRAKMQKDMERAGIIKEYNLGGFILIFFYARELREFIASKLRKDPYYLVT